MKFSDLSLHPHTEEAIKKLGFSDLTKIQEKALPVIEVGDDVAGLAQTGTGKTAAFLLPTLSRLYKTRETEGHEKIDENVKPFENWRPRNCVLILVPTRELADQVRANLVDLDPKGDFTSATVYGGVGYDKQKEALKDGVDFVIATPGRLIDLYKDKVFDPGLVKSVIFDEADRMFDMGFKDDMKYLLERIPRDRQFLVFSATLNFEVLEVAYEFGSDPVEVEIDRELPKTEQVKDEILHVGHGEKPQFLLSVLAKNTFEQAIIFTNFVRNVPKIEKFLRDNGRKALGISSALTQHQRHSVMEKFKDHKVNILVATDVAARGLDIENVDLVINYELPDDSENYVHRIGRTGRAGREGLAFSVVSEKDVSALERLENFLGEKLTIGWLDEDDIVKDFEPFPYDFDPRGKLGDLKGKGGGKFRREKSGGRDSKRKPYGKKGEKYSDKKGSEKKSSEYKKSTKQNGAPKSAEKKSGEKNFTKKKKSNNKVADPYSKFKTVSRNVGGQKKSVWQKFKGIFGG